MGKARQKGSIKKRSENSWQIGFFCHVDANGKRVDFRETVRGTYKDAARRLRQRLVEHDAGNLTASARLTLTEYFDRFLTNHSRLKNSPRTADGDQAIYDRYFRDTLGYKKLENLQPMEIQAVYTGLTNRGLTPQTVKHAHAVLRKSLNQAVKWQLINKNPALCVETPKVGRTERTVLDQAQVRVFLSACDEVPNGLIFQFAILTGMRPEEYLAVKWSDVDFAGKAVQVRRALVRHRGSWSFREPKTSRSRRTVTLPPSLVHKLVLHKQKQDLAKLKAKNLWEDHDLVFCSHFGSPLSVPNLTYRSFRPLLEKAGLPRIRLYDLRHTHATLLLAAEENPKVVSERLGHASISLTLDTYSHVLPNMQKRTSEKLERMLFTDETDQAVIFESGKPDEGVSESSTTSREALELVN